MFLLAALPKKGIILKLYEIKIKAALIDLVWDQLFQNFECQEIFVVYRRS